MYGKLLWEMSPISCASSHPTIMHAYVCPCTPGMGAWGVQRCTSKQRSERTTARVQLNWLHEEHRMRDHFASSTLSLVCVFCSRRERRVIHLIYKEAQLA